ncbi:ComGF family competence protein [Bacillus massiliigorillae]|uniref:ComGF family competence protein n=1 Tax=Bacillus massiliigorillae TaxID=1243664 RepID=UPI0003A7BB6E|nr:ComGF family competence protein [Bacillus massiliigorillae]
MATLILQIVLVIEPARPSSKSLNPMEWEVFINNVMREVRRGDTTTVTSTKVYINNSGSITMIEQYGIMLRRRVDYSGHEVLLHNVKHFTVSKIDSMIKINVIDTNDKAYEAAFLSYNE